ncbi:ABC-2 family transporter protein [Paenibacillus athensensis]|uniref:ABC transporter permease n=1 Tax=Paenibacillus athensensis TaxID=1967502 RepID=A0A4Y8PS67_9BACL|nr:ABC-2 family transporter protein [Paenibacillus athensensis]MCD1260557.1 ABC-2 family transporter protein [Paenibacillus athensensis]
MVYVAVALKSFAKNMAYRSEVWLRILGNLAAILIQTSIWKAIMGTSSASGINLQDMITYSIISTLVANLLMVQVFQSVDQKINSGNIAIDLLKPTRYPLILFFEQLGTIMFQFCYTVVPSTLLAWLLFGIHVPGTVRQVLLFVLSIGLAMLISFALGYMIALIAFWFLSTFALEWTIKALILVFSGSFLPLWFFSGHWRMVADLLPFRYLGFIPAGIYSGKIVYGEALQTILYGMVWVVILYGLIALLWWTAIRRLIVQGG